ncbi:Cell wall alpha-1,3-glucan synthase mok13 [Colletotrichum siamense]|uniref:alpha-1,3-glucan synthase n=1 Tax=Colletotrichum siamense TaxID=690259 RepID=A0A9P5BP72_COLSI|nr:Cell wall alpha-1,3-glucan synthase mok13 [Colletotrichum siamense]KAF4847113.1 Cell wall alpha-1,3-glucan synthase mok13 [Colletotrichum siamense]
MSNSLKVWALTLLTASTTLVSGLKYTASEVDYNLNTNREATDPHQYSGKRDNHTFHESPTNWRFPFYTLFIDRFVNGDPDNDNANGTLFEHDIMSNQLRHGGDVEGLIDTLDYIQGIGVKGIYIAGSPFINDPWKADSYSPLDLTLLDKHFGNITAWQRAIDEIHARGMYVVMDQTMATMGDLIGFEGYLNASTPFLTEEHKVVWKSSRRYLDFDIGNTYNESCEYPAFWFEDGSLVASNVTAQLKGCYDSDFDQYGDIEAFGVFPDWQRQLAKFASVQDRLREWVPSVRERLELYSCMTIQTLDIDGFRIDKAVQVTVDAQAEWSTAMRKCAKEVGKENFIVVGEITSGNTLGSIYLGRGRTPEMASSLELATAANMKSNDSANSGVFIREHGKSALDGGAFHYSIYRFMTRFLGMSGHLEAGYDLPTDWVQTWNQMVLTNDFYNANTGEFDPRHLYGVTNQDVFRWPAIELGTERMLLAYFITTLLLPGAPLVYYGEEQAFYVLDNTAENYVFGRQAFSAAQAWKYHGCYAGDNSVYVDWPITKGRKGCEDDTVAYDHRDPSHPMRNWMKRIFSFRDEYPVLEGGWLVEQLANQTQYILHNGSGSATETGIWSVARDYLSSAQSGKTSDPVWLVYHNSPNETTYTFDCNSDDAFIAPFDASSKVRNLFGSDDAITLESSSKTNTFTGTTKKAGCLSSITMTPFEFRAYVPSTKWKEIAPVVTGFEPGHDYPIDSTNANGVVPIAIKFSTEMTCSDVTNAISAYVNVDGNTKTNVTFDTPVCAAMDPIEKESWTGAIPSVYKWSANLQNVPDGIIKITLDHPAGNKGTNATDHFLVRFGKPYNPIVFPSTANYSRSLMKESNGVYTINHSAAGANKWRYSTNWGSSWSNWQVYTGANSRMVDQAWEGTDLQKWEGKHLIVQYWSQPLGSSSFSQHSDSSDIPYARRWPHVFLHGPFNKWGYDAGLPNLMDQVADNQWSLHFMYEWPAQVQLNLWGINPDNQPDVSFIYGDPNGDGVLDRLPPSSLSDNVVNLTSPPPMPYLSYKLVLNDANWNISAEPQGNMWIQIVFFFLLGLMPIVLAALAGWIYMKGFYQVKINKSGFSKKGWLPLKLGNESSINFGEKGKSLEMSQIPPSPLVTPAAAAATGGVPRRKVLIATMEYNIDDWKISIKIGGLGVMAKLMSQALTHVDLIWVVPVVGDVEYPLENEAEPMFVEVMGESYEVKVYYHVHKNITYVILDAPIFRQQTKADPYIARMDDLESAILYCAWNSCIAESIRRFNVDIYHINDYHGAAAPLYLLPETVPVCLSLHNAEFQGMWPMRTEEEQKEVYSVFNLPPKVVKDYVQYGSAFNLLHAAASYLRIHQRGFGAVGVSKKYGDRSLARYPIFWSLKNIGQLPNPDPSDTGEWNPEEDISNHQDDIKIDETFEANRATLRRQAQEWAGLEVNPNADLFVFVGRWSLQKGVDLIADIFPTVLEKYPSTQLICIGPVIDLYGKFAALKLAKLMEKYPKRVFSKPEFTQLPPYIFSGAEFALIPSRDEPFGLVAVEFGRKGALGVGARVGGLGQMPGFWFTVESMTPAHMLQQFKQAIESALKCKPRKRALMRAWSAKQRFPVAQWIRQLDTLYNDSIKVHKKEAAKQKKSGGIRNLTDSSLRSSVAVSEYGAELTPTGSRATSPLPPPTRVASPRISESPGLPVPNLPWHSIPSSRRSSFSSSIGGGRESMMSVDSFAIRAQNDATSPVTPGFGDLALPQPSFYKQQRNSSQLSLPDVVGDRHDLKLMNVDQNFTDKNGEFYDEFEQMLNSLTAKNSINDLCIENYLQKSEKKWFARYRDAKLGRRDHSRSRSPNPSRPGSSAGLGAKMDGERGRSRTPSGLTGATRYDDSPVDDEFLLGDNYNAPTGLKKILSIRIGDWPVYAFFLSFAQVISINSYQIVLLTGDTNQTPLKLYIVAATYLVTSFLWWFLVRMTKSVYALSLPWFFFGLAFLLLGVSPLLSPWQASAAMQDAATALYAAGASAGALSFALNFGDEGGAPTKQWIMRALAVAGVAQVYSLMLWYWGSLTHTPETSPMAYLDGTTIPKSVIICVPVACMLWAIGVILFLGLPDYYRQAPDVIPGFYISLIRRKLVPVFFIMIIIQNYWLSAPYGRNWGFLFASQFIPGWGVVLLALGFFVVLWGIILYVFSYFSESHTWLLPIFAIGLCAPRWAQMLWGTSSMGMYLPWAGGPVGSAILSRCLWLWLGLLDNIQGVGLGMMLLATLTRQHVLAVLIGAQIVGSAFTMLARATSPNALSPNTTFPDFSQGLMPGIASWWFWICLGFQMVIPILFFKFFRKEQVSKP